MALSKLLVLKNKVGVSYHDVHEFILGRDNAVVILNQYVDEDAKNIDINNQANRIKIVITLTSKDLADIRKIIYKHIKKGDLLDAVEV